MMAHDSVSGIIYNITCTYGQPLWSTTRAHRVRSCSSLFVPLAAPDCDSIAAVMVFRQRPDSSGIIDYYILTNHNPDTTITDFILHCQTSVYGRGFYPDRVTLPVTDRAQHVMITYCWQTWSAHHDSNGEVVLDHLNYESCHTYLALDVSTNFNQGEQGSFGGGGGGGSSSSNNNNNNDENNDSNEEEESDEEDEDDCLRGLSDEEMNLVRNLRSTIQDRNHCPTNKIFLATAKGITYKMEPCYQGKAQACYAFGNNVSEIRFYNPSYIKVNTLYEETFHAYQNQYYKGGLAAYQNKPGDTNIEFEAKLMEAIFCIYTGNLQDLSIANAFMSEFDSFQKWLMDYVRDGITDDFWDNYDHFIDLFCRKFSAYAGYVSSDFPRMQIIIDLLEGCND